MTADILQHQLYLQKARKPYALATVVEIIGSSSAKPAAKAVIDPAGKVLAGWIGGGCAQTMVAQTALDCLATGEPKVIDIDLTDEIFGAGMPCGGHMRVYVEPVLPKPMLWLIGHGRIVESLAAWAFGLGFDITVNDPQATSEAFGMACQIIADDARYQQLKPQAGDYVVIATHHKGDYEALTQALQSQAGYIALVASRKRAQLVLQRLARAGVASETLSRVWAPAGLALGGKTPEEIALAIASEMVMVRRGGQAQSLSRAVP